MTVDAPDVEIKNSRITGTGTYGILVLSGSVTVTDTEISGFENGIAGDNWSGYRLNIHGMKDDGVKLGSNVTLQDSWIHDLTPASDAHADGAQMQAGVENLVIRHNVIDLSSTTPANSAIFMAPDLGPSSPGPVTIADNWLNGGNYTLFCVDGNDGQYVVSGISIVNNKFGRSHTYGPTSLNVPIEQSGNVWEDTSEPLTL